EVKNRREGTTVVQNGVPSLFEKARSNTKLSNMDSAARGVVGFRLHGRPPLSSGRLAPPGLPEPSCETLLTVLLELRSQPLRALVRKCAMDAEVGLCIATVGPRHVWFPVLGVRRSGPRELG
ncbi:hypothetical protein J6590_028151, partial [Homalodisca vitripennis]